MTGPRFKPIPPEQMTAEQQRVVQALTDGPRGGLRGPFPALLRGGARGGAPGRRGGLGGPAAGAAAGARHRGGGGFLGGEIGVVRAPPARREGGRRSERAGGDRRGRAPAAALGRRGAGLRR